MLLLMESSSEVIQALLGKRVQTIPQDPSDAEERLANASTLDLCAELLQFSTTLDFQFTVYLTGARGFLMGWRQRVSSLPKILHTNPFAFPPAFRARVTARRVSTLQGVLDTSSNTPLISHSDDAKLLITPCLDLLHAHRTG